MKKHILPAIVLALMFVFAACTPEGPTDADNEAMGLWETIDALTQEIPFSQKGVETALSTQLTEKPLGSGNDQFHLFESQPVTLADGVIISNVDLRIKREGDHPGFLVLEMDVTGGTGVTLEQVQEQYSELTLTSIPSGNSPDEEFSYSQVLTWGKLTFGFKEQDSERLSSIAFDPTAKE
jgi:hypothetical protein